MTQTTVRDAALRTGKTTYVTEDYVSTNPTRKTVLSLSEMRSLLWLLHATDCGQIISGAEDRVSDLDNLRAVHARLANRSVRKVV